MSINRKRTNSVRRVTFIVHKHIEINCRCFLCLFSPPLKFDCCPLDVWFVETRLYETVAEKSTPSTGTHASCSVVHCGYCASSGNRKPSCSDAGWIFKCLEILGENVTPCVKKRKLGRHWTIQQRRAADACLLLWLKMSWRSEWPDLTHIKNVDNV